MQFYMICMNMIVAEIFIINFFLAMMSPVSTRIIFNFQ